MRLGFHCIWEKCLRTGQGRQRIFQCSKVKSRDANIYCSPQITDCITTNTTRSACERTQNVFQLIQVYWMQCYELYLINQYKHAQNLHSFANRLWSTDAKLFIEMVIHRLILKQERRFLLLWTVSCWSQLYKHNGLVFWKF